MLKMLKNILHYSQRPYSNTIRIKTIALCISAIFLTFLRDHTPTQ